MTGRSAWIVSQIMPSFWKTITMITCLHIKNISPTALSVSSVKSRLGLLVSTLHGRAAAKARRDVFGLVESGRFIRCIQRFGMPISKSVLFTILSIGFVPLKILRLTKTLKNTFTFFSTAMSTRTGYPRSTIRMLVSQRERVTVIPQKRAGTTLYVLIWTNPQSKCGYADTMSLERDGYRASSTIELIPMGRGV